MANIKIYKSRWIYFELALTVSDILTFQMFELQKVGQGHGIYISQCCPSMANIKIYTSSLMHFSLLSLTDSKLLTL